MSVKIYPSPEVSFTLISNTQFFAKNVQARENLEFIVEIHFEYELLKPDAHGSPSWERMQVAQEDQAKLQFFANTCNELFQVINRIVESERTGGLLKAVLGGANRSALYKEYDDLCSRASGDLITVHGRWNG